MNLLTNAASRVLGAAEPVEEFCAGQIAIAEVLGLYDSYDTQLGICIQVPPPPCTTSLLFRISLTLCFCAVCPKAFPT